MDANNANAQEFFEHVGFNPRARDGREFTVSCFTLGVAVSIHAPVMDAKPARRPVT